MGIENEPIPSISIINYEQSSSYTETSESEPKPHPTELSNQFEPDQAIEVGDVGGMTVNNEELRRVIEEGRKEIKDAQKKLNSSLTTPITESEAKVIEDGNWLSEVKDLNRRFTALPPIDMGKKIKGNGAMAFTID